MWTTDQWHNHNHADCIVEFLTWNMMASFSSWDTGHWDPKMVSIMSRKADRWRKLGLSFLKCSMKS